MVGDGVDVDARFEVGGGVRGRTQVGEGRGEARRVWASGRVVLLVDGVVGGDGVGGVGFEDGEGAAVAVLRRHGGGREGRREAEVVGRSRRAASHGGPSGR